MYHIHVKLKSINKLFFVKTMNKLSLIKANILRHMKHMNNLSLVKTIIELSITKA
jgi:hypothetical protein